MKEVYQQLRVGKSQHSILKILQEAGERGCTTAELEATMAANKTPAHLRVIQGSVRTLGKRGLVKQLKLKHNKNRWYYSELADAYMEYFPKVPPTAQVSEK